jgi:S-adenosylmethionine:tRNA ribosyltransferase-isomerase
MRIADFDFDLPERLIAQEPAARRDQSRLLVVHRASGTFTDAVFHQLPIFLQATDLLVLNNTRVFPARLIGQRVRETHRGEKILGARAEVFLVRQVGPMIWETLVRPGKALHEGAKIEFANGRLVAEVVEWRAGGRRLIRFHCQEDFNTVIDEIGRTPLPPYIKRDEETRLDQERYQTVFASQRGAIAAPTAGLHFTPELLERLKGQGIDATEITLHVGYGTFQPVKVEHLEEHQVEAERFTINETAAQKINAALSREHRVIAVGTTTTRALESCALPLVARTAMTELFIHPGFSFRCLSGLITNFHLPRSSLLVLVSAFAGRDLILEAYHHAVKNEYRFYSYGDACLIL